MRCRSLATLLVCVVGVSLGSVAQEVGVIVVSNFTKRTLGQTMSGFPADQSSRAAAGLSLEYSQWRGNNAASISYTISPTDSKIIHHNGFHDQWAITRNEIDVTWTRRLRSGRFEPFIKAGFGAILLNGAMASGLDRQFALVTGVGADLQISPKLALRYGVNMDFLRASNFSDTTYAGARTFIVEPRLGLVWKLASRRSRPL